MSAGDDIDEIVVFTHRNIEVYLLDADLLG